MLFKGLASAITKYHRVIIVVWLIGLAVSVPLLPHVSITSQQSLGTSSGESAKAQAIIDSEFANTTNGNVLFLVVTSDNVTTPNVRDFVGAFTNAAVSDSALTNITRITSVYGAVSTLVNGTVTVERSLRGGSSPIASFFYGTPATFVGVWNQSFALDPTKIGAATNMTASVLSASITNKTQLNAALHYLQAFSYALGSSYQSSPTAPLGLRLAAAINQTATGVINSAYPAAQRPFAIQVLRSFSLSNYSDPSAMERFVVRQVSTLTLFTQTFAEKVYPLSLTSEPVNDSSAVASIIVDPSSFDLPPVYKDVVDGFVSADHKVMIVVISFSGLAESDVSAVRKLVADLSPPYGLDPAVAVTGSVALSQDFRDASFGDLSLILPVTIAILIAATGIFFRSIVTPGITLSTIGIALGIADSAVIYLVGTYLVGIDPNITSILLTVIIGVGTDYSVFLLARYREERVRGNDKLAAISNSVAWAGESITTSGLTVIISFMFLGIFSSVPFLKGIGFVVGGGVLIALLGSLTLVPSIILLFPNFVFWPNVGARFANYAARVERSIERKSGYFSRSAKFSIKHAKLITVLALVATVPAAYAWSQAPVTYDFLAAAPKNLESVAAFNNVTQSFGAGTLYPTYAVVKFSTPVWNGTAYNLGELKAIDWMSNLTLGVQNVQGVTSPTRPAGQWVDYYSLGSDQRSKLLQETMNTMISENGTYALVKIDLTTSPESETSIATAQQLRDLYKTVVAGDPSQIHAIYLGGVAGSTLDSKNSVNSQFNQIIAYVMVGVAIVLLIVLGSLFLPLFAIVSIVMSIAWTLAATNLVFQSLYNFPLLFITPLALFVLLLGLGMDYNIFILTRIREEASKGASLNEAITTAIERTGGIITAAALILAGSLGALMISNNLLLKEFGFAFFYSVLIDAMIMRTYVVPSVMSLMGKWNWYAPGRLQRVRMADAKKS